MAFAVTGGDWYVRFNGGNQSVVVIPLDGRGVPTLPSAASGTIVDLRYPEDGSDREILAAGAGSIDSASTTLSAAAGAGQANRALLSVASAAGLVEGHAYLLTDATTSRRELVWIDTIDGTSIYLRSNLTSVFASASTLEGIEVTWTFPTAEAADESRLDAGGGPYALDVTWTGVDPVNARFIGWVRRNPERALWCTVQDCVGVDPTLGDELANHGRNTPHNLMVQAHLDWEADLREVGVDPANHRGSHNAREYVKHRWAFRGRMLLPGDEDDYNDRLAKEHFARARSLLSTFQTRGGNPIGTVTPDRDEDEAEDGTSTQTTQFFARS